MHQGSILRTIWQLAATVTPVPGDPVLSSDLYRLSIDAQICLLKLTSTHTHTHSRVKQK